MNAPVKVEADPKALRIAREREKIRALIEALRKKDHWLEKAEYWSEVSDRDPANALPRRGYRSCLDRAEEVQPEILEAAYALLEIDAIHAAYMECRP